MKGQAMRANLRHITIAVLLALLAACGPEAGRPRGGGAGADVGNHAEQKAEIPASKIKDWNPNNEP